MLKNYTLDRVVRLLNALDRKLDGELVGGWFFGAGRRGLQLSISDVDQMITQLRAQRDAAESEVGRLRRTLDDLHSEIVAVAKRAAREG